MARKISFVQSAFNDYVQWATEDKKVFLKLTELIIETSRNPFEGKGKPEALKHELKGKWSRRIIAEHRLIYEAKEDELIIFACKYHY